MSLTDQIEGRNAVIEALRRRRRRVLRVLLDERARPGGKVDAILELAARQGVPVESVPRRDLDRMSLTGAHNGVLAIARPLPGWTVTALLEDLARRSLDPFLVLVDEVAYEHNLGAVLRTACGAGAHAVVVPVRRGKGLTPVVQRVAMGAAEDVPLIREGLLSAVALLRRAGVRVVGADPRGTPLWRVELRGPVALVFGGEDKGLSGPLRSRCDDLAAVPLGGDIGSLNVSVAAGILLFEKVRQEREGLARAPG